ncbi:hypothetical protein MRX96_042736 [Rhipicephalus microplus]
MCLVSPHPFQKTSRTKPLSLATSFVVVCVTTFGAGTDVVQRPVVTSCMTGKHGFRLRDFTIEGYKVGHYMRVNYTVDVLRQGDRSPAVKFTVHNSPRAAGALRRRLRLLACGGTKLTERMIGAAWNNSCESIPPGTYQSSVLLKVIPAVRLVMGNGTFNIRVEGITDKGQVECVSFYIFIED